MKKNKNEVFEFNDNTNEELDQTNDFNYDSISGLGESDYENEDLFSNEDLQNIKKQNCKERI